MPNVTQIKHKVLQQCIGLGGPLLVLAMLLFFQYGAPSWQPALIFDRSAIQQGDYWRLLSGHFVHTNGTHLWLNSCGLIALWLVHGNYYRTSIFLTQTVFLGLCIGAGLWLFCPEVKYYLGFSGILHGLLVWGACHDITRRLGMGYVLLAVCYLKIAIEYTIGPSAATMHLIESEVGVQSHLLGTVIGSLAGLIEALNKYRR